MFFVFIVATHNIRLERDPRQNPIMLKFMGGCAVTVVTAMVASKAMSRPTPHPLVFSLLLLHGYFGFAATNHSSFLCQIEPEDATEPHANPPRVVAPVAAYSHDITDRKHAEEALSRMAHYDTLTGLPNRARLLGRLETDVVRGAGDLAVLFCDLDGFKEVNDTLGHEMGDEVLRQVRGRWSGKLRASDVLGRWGGDEFVVICPANGDPDDVALVAERLTSCLEAPLLLGTRKVAIGVSIGSVVQQQGESADELLRRADTAMYQAKRAKHRLPVE